MNGWLLPSSNNKERGTASQGMESETYNLEVSVNIWNHSRESYF